MQGKHVTRQKKISVSSLPIKKNNKFYIVKLLRVILNILHIHNQFSH